MTRNREEPTVLALLATGVAGVTGVAAIGSAVIAYGTRRARTRDREETAAGRRP
jgi:hypothetical protein